MAHYSTGFAPLFIANVLDKGQQSVTTYLGEKTANAKNIILQRILLWDL